MGVQQCPRSLNLFWFNRSPARASSRLTGAIGPVYNAWLQAPLSGSAGTARAWRPVPWCCPSRPDPAERGNPGPKTSGGGPGTSVSRAAFLERVRKWGCCAGSRAGPAASSSCLFMRKQILFCPPSSCWSRFLFRLYFRFSFSTETSCEFSFLTLLGGN